MSGYRRSFVETPITIHPPTLEPRGDGFRVQCRVDGAHADCIWFEVDRNPGAVGVEQIADAFVLPGVIGAVARGRDVHLAFPIS